jgi:hypothetical protein
MEPKWRIFGVEFKALIADVHCLSDLVLSLFKLGGL